MANATSTPSLCAHLLSLSPQAYEAATQAPFLLAAGQGRLDKQTLGTWLANDRLYLYAYLQAVGRTLAAIDLPQTTPPDQSATRNQEEAPETRLVDWLVATLAALRREERLFGDVARRYGLAIDLETQNEDEDDDDEDDDDDDQDEDKGNAPSVDGLGARKEAHVVRRKVPDTAKLDGLIMFERLFGSLHPAAASVDRRLPVPWLEAAVVFWGTEKVYCDAWRWAQFKQHQQHQQQHQQKTGGVDKGVRGGVDDARVGKGDGDADADGGALRRELIPNWANEEFREFVEQLARIIDGAVKEAVAAAELGDAVKASLTARAEKVWGEVVAAEEAFWPII